MTQKITINNQNYVLLSSLNIDKSQINKKHIVNFNWLEYILDKFDKNKELEIHNIDWVDYVPLPKIQNHISYSYARIRWLLAKNEIPQTQVKRICNLTFIKVSYLKTLELRFKDPEKLKKQVFCINQYYWNLDNTKIENPKLFN